MSLGGGFGYSWESMIEGKRKKKTKDSISLASGTRMPRFSRMEGRKAERTSKCKNLSGRANRLSLDLNFRLGTSLVVTLGQRGRYPFRMSCTWSGEDALLFFLFYLQHVQERRIAAIVQDRSLEVRHDMGVLVGSGTSQYRHLIRRRFEIFRLCAGKVPLTAPPFFFLSKLHPFVRPACLSRSRWRRKVRKKKKKGTAKLSRETAAAPSVDLMGHCSPLPWSDIVKGVAMVANRGGKHTVSID